MSEVIDRLAEVGITMPERRWKNSGKVQYKIVDDLLFISGISPILDDGTPAYTGRLGTDLSLEEVYKAGRLVGLNMLRIIKDALGGDFDRVDYFIKCVAAVSAPDDGRINQAADGFSDLMTEFFGERGKHARNAIGASTLNANVPIVCDAIIKLR